MRPWWCQSGALSLARALTLSVEVSRLTEWGLVGPEADEEGPEADEELGTLRRVSVLREKSPPLAGDAVRFAIRRLLAELPDPEAPTCLLHHANRSRLSGLTVTPFVLQTWFKVQQFFSLLSPEPLTTPLLYILSAPSGVRQTCSRGWGRLAPRHVESEVAGSARITRVV